MSETNQELQAPQHQIQEGRQRISEDWLRSVGFKWHQLERQPHKQWLLWLADTFRTRGDFTCFEDLGIELSMSGIDAERPGDQWHCWLRADTSHRYSRFLHIRPLRYIDELIRMIEGLTGQEWDPMNNVCGSMVRPEVAARYRADQLRLDQQMLRDRPKWYKGEKDESQGRALPEHLDAHERAKTGEPQGW